MKEERLKFHPPRDGNDKKIKAAVFLNWVLENMSDEEYQEIVENCKQTLQREIDEVLITKLWLSCRGVS